MARLELLALAEGRKTLHNNVVGWTEGEIGGVER